MTGATTPFGRHRVEPPVLVGRERERRLLRDRLAAALAGAGRLVLIGGEAGIGKTASSPRSVREAAAARAASWSGAATT